MEQPQKRSPYQQLGGDAAVKQLVNRFYDLMDEDTDVVTIRKMHPEDITESREKLYEFLCGFLGGPSLYHQNRGRPMLRMRHLPFKIDEQARDQWLSCMHRALEEQTDDTLLLMQLKSSFYKTAQHMINQQHTSD